MKRLFSNIIFLTIISLCIFSCAKDEKPIPGSINWTRYTRSDGVLEGLIRTVALDSSGNLWFGSDYGLCKFDGKKFINYSLPHDEAVRSIAIDKQQNMWIGTYGSGLVKYDGTIWTYYKSDPNNSNSIKCNDVTTIAIDSLGNKWIGTLQGVSKFDGTKWINYTNANGLSNNCIFSISTDKQGKIWFATATGVSMFDGTQFNTYNYINGIRNRIADVTIWSIGFDRLGHKWFGSVNGLTEYDGINWTQHNTETDWLIKDYDVLSMVTDPEGNLWFGTDKGGLTVFDGKNWTTYPKANGIDMGYIQAIGIDIKGNKWLCKYSEIIKMEVVK